MAIDWAREAEAAFGGGQTSAAPSATAGDYGPPLYDPDALLVEGVPEPLVNAYKAAVRAYEIARVSAGDQFDRSGTTALTQAGTRLRGLESQVTAYFKPVTPKTPPIADTSKKPYLRNETGEQMPNEDYVPTSTFEDTDGNDRVLRDRLTGRIISRLGPIVAKPGEGTFTHGNKVYKWDANGQPVPIYEFPASADADAVQWATLAQRKAEFEAKQRADAEAAERAWKQFVEEQERSDARNRLTNTTNFTNDILSTWTKAAPMALLPGQTQFLGANPGGLMDRIAQMGRFTPDEAARNVQPFNIDPDVALQWARNAAAGGK